MPDGEKHLTDEQLDALARQILEAYLAQSPEGRIGPAPATEPWKIYNPAGPWLDIKGNLHHSDPVMLGPVALWRFPFISHHGSVILVVSMDGWVGLVVSLGGRASPASIAFSPISTNSAYCSSVKGFSPSGILHLPLTLFLHQPVLDLIPSIFTNQSPQLSLI